MDGVASGLIRGRRSTRRGAQPRAGRHVHAVEQQTARVEQLTKDMTELVATWSLQPLVNVFQALRGVRLVSAVILAAEIGSFCAIRPPRRR